VSAARRGSALGAGSRGEGGRGGGERGAGRGGARAWGRGGRQKEPRGLPRGAAHAAPPPRTQFPLAQPRSPLPQENPGRGWRHLRRRRAQPVPQNSQLLPGPGSPRRICSLRPQTPDHLQCLLHRPPGPQLNLWSTHPHAPCPLIAPIIYPALSVPGVSYFSIFDFPFSFWEAETQRGWATYPRPHSL
jgi:hypothetical protein